MATRVKRVKGGVRMEQHGCVLSEIRANPGPTHSIFDVLAAAVHVFAPGERVAMLGFAGGGMIAPLRALGGQHEVHGVDLDGEGYRLYRKTAKSWGGRTGFEKDDAVVWLRRQRGRFDAVVEDLSVAVDDDVVKPPVSWEVLPALMKRKVKARGVLISNLLPTPGMSWEALISACRTGPGVVVGLEQFHNRVLIQGSHLGSVREAGSALRAALRELGSDLAGGITLRSLQG